MDKTKNAHVTNKHDATATNPSKSKKGSKKERELTKANVANAVEKTKDEKESKYLYPADVNTPEKKKVFRRNARAQRGKFEKILEKLRASNEKKDKEELKKTLVEQKDWMKKTYHIIPEIPA